MVRVEKAYVSLWTWRIRAFWSCPSSLLRTESRSACNPVVGCVNVCQQTLVIMTYLHCLLWLFPVEATPRLNDSATRSHWNTLNINKVIGVANLFVVPQNSQSDPHAWVFRDVSATLDEQWIKRALPMAQSYTHTHVESITVHVDDITFQL